jgi:hypothetical protein
MSATLHASRPVEVVPTTDAAGRPVLDVRTDAEGAPHPMGGSIMSDFWIESVLNKDEALRDGDHLPASRDEALAAAEALINSPVSGLRHLRDLWWDRLARSSDPATKAACAWVIDALGEVIGLAQFERGRAMSHAASLAWMEAQAARESARELTRWSR